MSSQPITFLSVKHYNHRPLFLILLLLLLVLLLLLLLILLPLLLLLLPQTLPGGLDRSHLTDEEAKEKYYQYWERQQVR